MSDRNSAFTLIEISVVLVIIGLIVGGLLVGQDLIRAAGTRAQITQITKLNTAVNTFRDKYGGVPGDLSFSAATAFGLSARTGTAGNGDGNGVIEGTYTWFPASAGLRQGQGETGLFWVDLTSANGANVNLIEGDVTQISLHGANYSGAQLAQWFPEAKIGAGNYLYVYSLNGLNYYGLSAVSVVGSTGVINSAPGLTVTQAFNLDKKIDDAMPQQGNITAQFLNYAAQNNTTESAAGSGQGAAGTASTAGSSTTCYDNGGNGGTVQQYSVEIGNNNLNCAISIRFQ